MGKPLLAGVPNWLIDHWLAALKDGRMDSYNQRELHKVLLHKWSGKPGVPDLTCPHGFERTAQTRPPRFLNRASQVRILPGAPLLPGKTGEIGPPYPQRPCRYLR